MKQIIVLISGRGSNLKALQEYFQKNQLVRIVSVISNKADALGLEYAKTQSIVTHCVLSKGSTQDFFEAELKKIILSYDIELIVLAGFMKILSKEFVNFFDSKIINLHPALLPAFKGNNAIEEALQSQVKITGSTVHFVNEFVDSGKIIAQGVVPVLADDTKESLGERVLKLEHQMYPFIITKLLYPNLALKIDNANIFY